MLPWDIKLIYGPVDAQKSKAKYLIFQNRKLAVQKDIYGIYISKCDLFDLLHQASDTEAPSMHGQMCQRC